MMSSVFFPAGFEKTVLGQEMKTENMKLSFKHNGFQWFCGTDVETVSCRTAPSEGLKIQGVSD